MKKKEVPLSVILILFLAWAALRIVFKLPN